MVRPRDCFSIHRPDSSIAVPVIIHVPHASDHIPEHCCGDFILNDDDLAREMAAMVDHYTDQIAMMAVAMGAHVFRNDVCHLVVDPERFPDDADAIAATWGMGAVYTHTHDGRRLRRGDWTATNRAKRMLEFYSPYHDAIRKLALKLHGRFASHIHILDLHLFPSTPFPYETALDPRPCFCLGSEERYLPVHWLMSWRNRAQEESATDSFTRGPDFLATNRRFSGSFLPAGLPFADRGVRSFMVEINRVQLPQYPSLDSSQVHPGCLRVLLDFMSFICTEACAAQQGCFPLKKSADGEPV